MKAVYHRTVVRAGRTVEIIETYPTKFGDGFTRENAGRQSVSSAAQKAYNDELAIRRLTRILNENFGPDDLFVTLHYELHNRPATLSAAKTQLTYFLRKLGRRYIRQGIELRYVRTTAYGEKGALHHHIVIPKRLNTTDITRLWQAHIKSTFKARPPEYRALYDTGEYSSLAAYLFGQAARSKAPDEEFEDIFGAKHWSCSRNCRVPQPEPPKVIEEIKWKEPPRAWNGYYIDTDSIRADVNPVNGRPYLFYRMVKLPPDYFCYDDDGNRIIGSAAIKYTRRKNIDWIRENWRSINTAGDIVLRGGDCNGKN